MAFGKTCKLPASFKKQTAAGNASKSNEQAKANKTMTPVRARTRPKAK